jgi:peptidoglycan/LPS O-acetylase OafA/YrhL
MSSDPTPDVAATARLPAGGRLPGLDLLRATAIAWTMAYHGSLYGLASGEHWVVGFGWMGVDLFFVLSGYLIAGQLLRGWAQGRPPAYGTFMARRLFRTLPAYLCIVALYFALPALRDRPVIQPLWQFLSFTTNFGLVPPKAFSHAWSLCVEEHFYLVFPPIAALLATRARRRGTVLAVAAVLGLGMLVRAGLWLSQAAVPAFDPLAAADPDRYMTWLYYPTWSRLDGLLAGVVAAAVQVYRPAAWAALTARPNRLVVLGAAGVIASAVVFRSQIPGLFGAVLGYPLLAWSLACWVVAATDPRSVLARRSVPGAHALAAGAYSLYLSHKMVFHLVQVQTADWPGPVAYARVALAAIGALAVGAALYFGVERPFLRLRDRVLARPAAAGRAVPADARP